MKLISKFRGPSVAWAVLAMAALAGATTAEARPTARDAQRVAAPYPADVGAIAGWRLFMRLQ